MRYASSSQTVGCGTPTCCCCGTPTCYWATKNDDARAKFFPPHRIYETSVVRNFTVNFVMMIWRSCIIREFPAYKATTTTTNLFLITDRLDKFHWRLYSDLWRTALIRRKLVHMVSTNCIIHKKTLARKEPSHALKLALWKCTESDELIKTRPQNADTERVAHYVL